MTRSRPIRSDRLVKPRRSQYQIAVRRLAAAAGDLAVEDALAGAVADVGVEQVDGDPPVEVDLEQQAHHRQQVLDLRQILAREAARAVGGPGGAVDPAVAEGDRQGDIVGQALLAQLVEQREGELAVGEVEPLAHRPGALEQDAHRAVLEQAVCSMPCSARNTPGARRRRGANRTRCRTAAGCRVRKWKETRASGNPCSSRRMHSSFRSAGPSGSRRASPISQSRTGPGRRGQ